MLEILADKDWDRPFFKVLALNDSGEGVGHQGGIVFPKELRKFLPTLEEAVTSNQAPTVDRFLLTDLYAGDRYVGTEPIRYQLQTWGGKRGAESRITKGLGPIRILSREDDILVFQRKVNSLDTLRIFLVQSSSPEYEAIKELAGDRRWGILDVEEVPVSLPEIQRAVKQLSEMAQEPFQLQRDKVRRVLSAHMRISRDTAFRENVRREYRYRCAVSGVSLSTTESNKRLYEVEAAHVVPLNRGGTDDFRNGISLCQSVHWAFDKGLFGILPDRRVYLPKVVKSSNGNNFLKTLEGKKIIETQTANFKVHPDALEWHRDNIVSKWN